MKIRRFFGKDMRETLKQVKEELGGDAVIMSNKKVANGVELVAAIDPSSPPEVREKEPAVKPTPTLRDIVGDTDSDSLQALLEKQINAQNQNLKQSQPSSTPTPNAHSQTTKNSIHDPAFKSQDYQSTLAYGGDIDSIQPEAPRADERIFRSPAFVSSEHSDGSDPAPSHQAESLMPPPSVLEPAQLDVIKAELESIKNVLKFQVSELAEERKKRNNPVHQYLRERIIRMGLSDALANQFVEFLPHQIDETEGWKYILNLLSNRLHVGGNDILNATGVVALVGPTGTGKTTTLAKLAAKYAQKYGPEQVALITIDTYRIAAYEQLATYGKIIGCAVKKAHNSNQLNEILYQMRNKKLVLIDTAGFSQRDARLIEQLKQYEANINVQIRKFLVLPAGSQYQVLNQTIKAYSGTDIQGCIFTKLDECYSLGEALSVIIENDLSLSYVTDGQRVPEDIKLADSANLTYIAAKLFNKYGKADSAPSLKTTNHTPSTLSVGGL